jgi:6-pyruvoyltetrahydropterin/6-carboxytetrahydropterin synthase
MGVDFKQLKDIVNEYIIDKFDHALIRHTASPLSNELAGAYPNVMLVDFQPSTENLLCLFAQILKDRLPQGVELFSIKLYETAGSYAEWYASDNI